MSDEIRDEAWIKLIETLEQVDVGGEISFGLLNDRGDKFSESELLTLLDRAAELGMIEQINSRTWIRRDPVQDWTPLEEYEEQERDQEQGK